MFRYFRAKGGWCSVKFLSDCGGPASRSAIFKPASARRLHAHPPEAPEPITSASNSSFELSAIRNPLSLLYLSISTQGVNEPCHRHRGWRGYCHQAIDVKVFVEVQAEQFRSGAQRHWSVE